jgi:hypothetical protein
VRFVDYVDLSGLNSDCEWLGCQIYLNSALGATPCNDLTCPHSASKHERNTCANANAPAAPVDHVRRESNEVQTIHR